MKTASLNSKRCLNEVASRRAWCAHDVEYHRVPVTRRAAACNSVFKNHDVSLSLKLRLLNACVFCVITYGAKSWTVIPELKKKIYACENRWLKGVGCKTFKKIRSPIERWEQEPRRCSSRIKLPFNRRQTAPAIEIHRHTFFAPMILTLIYEYELDLATPKINQSSVIFRVA